MKKSIAILFATFALLSVRAQTFNEGETNIITFTQLSLYSTRIIDLQGTNQIILRTFSSNQVTVISPPDFAPSGVITPGVYQIEVKGLPARKYNFVIASITEPFSDGTTLISDLSTNVLITIKPRPPGLSKVDSKK